MFRSRPGNTLLLSLLAVCIFPSVCLAQFTNMGDVVTPVTDGAVAWGDFDNDGDLDVAVAGYQTYDAWSPSNPISRIYRNDGGGVFSNINAGLVNVSYAALAWGDYDGDGDLDLALAGYTDSGCVSKIYRNDGNSTFTDIDAGLVGVQTGSLAWGDYDNDGDLDLALCGIPAGTPNCVSKIYRNDGSDVFADIAANVAGLCAGCLAWGDYDRDGDLDLAIAGTTASVNGVSTSKIYRNDGSGVFTDSGVPLVGVSSSSLAWGDYDSDGDLDLALAGSYYDTSTHHVSTIYRNNGNGTFTDIGANFGVTGSVAWGDYDNDGDPDLVIAGRTGAQGLCRIYRNDAGLFSTAVDLVSLNSIYVAWGDYDNDGDLDLIVLGHYSSSTPYYLVGRLYRNDSSVHNAVPSKPAGLSVTRAGGDAAFNWSASTDAETGPLGLSYNLRVGTTPGGNDVSCGMADASGLRGIPATGSVRPGLSWQLHGLKPGTYYWSVQAVDTAFAGSPWADEQAFTVPAITVSGNVRNPDGTALQGAIVSASSIAAPVTTDSTGWYQITLPEGWSGSVRVSKVGYLFDPPSRSYSSLPSNQAGQDYTALRQCRIAGQVRAGCRGPGVAGVTVTATNGGGSTTTDANGDYELWVQPHWTGVVTPTKSLCSFSPADRSYEDIAEDQTGEDYGSITFTDMRDSLGIREHGCSGSWGDYDNDGRLDLMIVADYGHQARIYHNDQSGAFTLTWSGPMASGEGVSGKAAWGDYDNDGDLDFVMSQGGGAPSTTVCRNDGSGVFTDVKANIIGVDVPSFAWGDYDNDGDLDLAMSGAIYGGGVTRIYRNNGTDVFTDIGAGLPSVCCALAWVDYDNDGDLDLALAGPNCTGIYRNDGGVLTYTHPGFANVAQAALAWGDYDSDGDLDVVIAGLAGSSRITRIYRNDGSGAFTDINAGLVGVSMGGAAWGDYDNDGDPDLLLVGETDGGTHVSMIYRNDGGGVFTDVNAVLAADYDYNTAAWGDYDNDGDLDLAIGRSICRNDRCATNTAPAAPGGLSTSVSDENITFSWNSASDAETPAGGLSYNIRVGTSPGAGNILSGSANVSTGWRRVPALGNAQKRLSWSIKNLEPGVYYWSVQAVDAALAGSPWAAEASVTQPQVLISGTVRNAAGNGLAGVLVSPTAGGIPATTDSVGHYQVAVTSGWSGSTTPSKVGYTFLPASRSYSHVTAELSDQDYTASAFVDCGVTLAGVQYSALAWGDYDSDGDLDLAMSGGGASYMTKIYRNDGSGVFTDINAGLTGVYGSALAWGDYDNDGDLDLALSGQTSAGSRISKIYRNDSGVFTGISAVLTGVAFGSLAWADYDNDGRLDLALGGRDSSGSGITRVYRNGGGGVFTDTGMLLASSDSGRTVWCDYDNDGDLDLIVSGTLTTLYRNDGGSLVDSGTSWPYVYNCSLDWGDYDNDGDQDLALVGYCMGAPISRIYRNDGGTFTDIGAGLVGVGNSSVAWGDYDNDGDPDLALAGTSGSGSRVAKVYRNDGNGVFTDAEAGLVGVDHCSVAWADYNGDRKLDLALAGYTGDQPILRIYRNDGGRLNTVPSVPGGPSVHLIGDSMVFGWSASSDAETASSGLSYNLRVGTSSGADDVFSGMANPGTGYRRLPAIGNAQKKLSWALKQLPAATVLYWSVQAVDTAFAGSPWATERQWTVRDDLPPVINSVTVTPSLAAAGDGLTLTVDAADNVMVNSVTTGEVTLAKTGPTTWAATILASPVLGAHAVTVNARDGAGNSSSANGSYKTAKIVGLSTRRIADAIMPGASANFLFSLWGRVTVIDSTSFFLDDGSGVPVRVVAASHGLSTGDYASARGILDESASPAVLNSRAYWVTKHR